MALLQDLLVVAAPQRAHEQAPVIIVSHAAAIVDLAEGGQHDQHKVGGARTVYKDEPVCACCNRYLISGQLNEQ